MVLAPLAVALVGAFVAFRSDLFPEPLPPERVPAPPAAVVRLVGVDSYGFGSAVVVVEGADGLFYRYQWQVGWEAPTDQPGDDLDEGGDCQPRARRELEAAAGPLGDCLSGQVWGEWCPGPLASYALAANGAIWLHLQPRPCTTPFFTGLGVCLPVAALIGAGLALLVWLGVRLSARRE